MFNILFSSKHDDREDKIVVLTLYGLGTLSVLWIMLGWISFNVYAPSISLNEVGDFIAGWSAPMMLIWFVSAVFLQMRELRIARKAYSAQTDELKETAEANRRSALQSQVNTLKSLVDDYMLRRRTTIDHLYETAEEIKGIFDKLGTWAVANTINFSGRMVNAHMVFHNVSEFDPERPIEKLAPIPMASKMHPYIDIIREQTKTSSDVQAILQDQITISGANEKLLLIYAEMMEIWDEVKEIYSEETLKLIMASTGFGELLAFLQKSDQLAQEKLEYLIDYKEMMAKQ